MHPTENGDSIDRQNSVEGRIKKEGKGGCCDDKNQSRKVFTTCEITRHLNYRRESFHTETN